ncbi:MAG: hypothetical protein HOP11_10845 [Saprospiraceae bacterium]|nr:hypothetical protein [Saprospiraceae bacterium]
MEKYNYLILLILLCSSQVSFSQDQNFIKSAKNLIENFYSKLDNIRDGEHPLSREQISFTKQDIIDNLILIDNGKNLYNNITKTNIIESYYDPSEYLDYYTAEYEGHTIQHALHFINKDTMVRNTKGRKVLPLVYEVRVNKIVDNESYHLRTDTITHNIIFKLINGSDISDQAQIQNTEKFLTKNLSKKSLSIIIEIDTDHDGVTDKDDECQDVFGTLRGCPDRDGDKVPDKDDKCPEIAGLISKQGCPEVQISRYIEIPLTFIEESTTAGKRGVLAIKDNKEIENSGRPLFLGTEKFYGSYNKVLDRWNKQINYLFSIEEVKFSDGKVIKLSKPTLSIYYDERDNIFTSDLLKLDLNKEIDLYNYLTLQ